MVDGVTNFFLFSMGIATPVIAIIAELSHRTPTSFAFSLIRSIICVGSLVFASMTLNPNYRATNMEIISMTFIFACSFFRLIQEMYGIKLFESDHQRIKR